jgi:hypothetical protein
MAIKLTDHDAFGHPSYDSSIHSAADRAFRNPGDCFSVYFDGEAIFVRASEAAPPLNSKRICIAQRWNDKTVQLRFAGARSEWINR